MKLGDRLRQLREAKEWTSYALAHAAGMTPTQVKTIEDGLNQNPKLETLLSLARALGVEVGELIGPTLDLAPEDAEALAPAVVPLEPEPAAAHSGAAAAIEVRRSRSGETLSLPDAARLVEESMSVFREALKRAADPHPLDPKPKSGVRRRLTEAARIQ